MTDCCLNCKYHKEDFLEGNKSLGGATMSREELEEKLAYWERKQFINQMCDHWDAEDFALDRECTMNIQHIKELLEEIKDE